MRRPVAPKHLEAVRQFAIPKRYPLVQFPNAPLLVALLAWSVGLVVTGTAQDYVSAVGVVALAAWAWLEATDGINLVRRLLGIAVLFNTVISLAHRFA